MLVCMSRGSISARDARVNLRELAPVRARVLVMGGVQAVVEEQEVQEAAVEAARVVVLRPGVGVDVLHVVEHMIVQSANTAGTRHTRPQTYRPGLHAVERDREREEHHVRADPHHVLEQDRRYSFGLLWRALRMNALIGSLW